MILKKTLEITRATKFLGVFIDNKLKWTDHIIYIKIKFSTTIGIIHRTRTFLDEITFKNLHHSFVFPFLIYCTEIWGNSATIHLNPIIILQNKDTQAQRRHYKNSMASLRSKNNNSAQNTRIILKGTKIKCLHVHGHFSEFTIIFPLLLPTITLDLPKFAFSPLSRMLTLHSATRLQADPLLVP